MVLVAILANRENKDSGGSNDYSKYTRQDIRLVV
jgi:hypothetical protein